MKRLQMKSVISIIAGSALVFALVAAAAPKKGNAKAEAETPTETVAAPPTATEPAFLYTFVPMGKRDPFRSPLQDLRGEGGLVNEACHDPLCQFDLQQLDLVAVVTGDANPFAMVEDPQGRGHVVRRNTRVGRQGGKVTQILGDSVTVTEFVTGVDGKSTPFASSLKLNAQTQGKAPVLDLLSGKTIP